MKPMKGTGDEGGVRGAPSAFTAFAPHVVTAIIFVVLFAGPIQKIVYDWWTSPDAGHGLLLAPLAVVLAWRKGVEDVRPQPYLGLGLLVAAVILRVAGGLAAELFTMRLGMFTALLALIVFYLGAHQIVRWWLPLALLFLSIPLPAIVLNALSAPLQLEASRMGAALLEARRVPVLLTGNVIHLPGRSLFVTEACSGLRSLSALLALGVLVSGLWLRWPLTRVLLILSAIPVAMLLNGVRIFLTGFLVYYVDPGMGEGFLHMTEGWIIFVVAFAILGSLAWLMGRVEGAVARRRAA